MIDTYVLLDSNLEEIPINENNLIYSGIKDNNFKRGNDYLNNQYIDVENGNPFL